MSYYVKQTNSSDSKDRISIHDKVFYFYYFSWAKNNMKLTFMQEFWMAPFIMSSNIPQLDKVFFIFIIFPGTKNNMKLN